MSLRGQVLATGIVKLGGSVITDKSTPFSFRPTVVKRLGSELKAFLKARPKARLILVHGGGSYGHPLVKRALAEKGVIDDECYVDVVNAMRALNAKVVDVLRSIGLKVAPVQTSATFILGRGEPVFVAYDVLTMMLSRGIIPVLYGDVVLRREGGYAVLSGDTIVALLSRDLRCHRIVLVTDVDGVYVLKDGRPVLANRLELKAGLGLHGVALWRGEQRGEDVTGGMYGKLMEVAKYCEPGTEVLVVNGFREGALYNALLEGLAGTSILIS